MCWKVILYELILITIHTHASSHNHHSKSKRSPLEIGYVQFTLPAQHSATAHQGITIHVPSVVTHGHNTTTAAVDGKPHVMLAHNNGALYMHRTHWEPGHVHNHAFIPGRVHHVLVPTHTLLVTHPVHAVLLHPAVTVSPAVNLYRKHYGGFGVGVDYGGRGAGHGYHVL